MGSFSSSSSRLVGFGSFPFHIGGVQTICWCLLYHSLVMSTPADSQIGTARIVGVFSLSPTLLHPSPYPSMSRSSS